MNEAERELRKALNDMSWGAILIPLFLAVAAVIAIILVVVFDSRPQAGL